MRGLELVGPHDMMGHDAGQQWARVSRAVVKSHGHRAAVQVAPPGVLKLWRGRLSQAESDSMIARMDVPGFLAAQLVGLDGFGAGDPYFFIEGPNEPGAAQARRLVAFYQQLKQMASDLGYRVTGFNMATGDYDKTVVECMREAELDLWAFHCYMTRIVGPTPWNMERPFAKTDEFPEGLVLPGDPEWVANEFGHDRTRDGYADINEGYLPLGNGPYGWEVQFQGLADPLALAFAQLVGAADRFAALAPRCRGLCLFTTSPDATWRERGFDCDRLARVFVDALHGLPPSQDGQQPPPGHEPAPTPTPPAPVPPAPNPPPYNPPQEAPVPNYTGPHLLGVDVSNNNPNVDWVKVRAAGKSFAFAKASGDEADEVQEDDWQYFDRDFPRNWREMAMAGLVRGAYHYAKPSKVGPAKSVTTFEEAITNAGGLLPGDLVCLDLEDPDVPPGHDLTVWTAEWLDLATRVFGFKPVLYTGTYYLNEHDIEEQELGKYPLWLASYQLTVPPVPTGWPRLHFWQYSQDAHTPGIGKSLLDLFFGSKEELLALGKPGAVGGTGIDWGELTASQDALWELSEKLYHAKTMPKKVKQRMALEMQNAVKGLKRATGQE